MIDDSDEEESKINQAAAELYQSEMKIIKSGDSDDEMIRVVDDKQIERNDSQFDDFWV